MGILSRFTLRTLKRNRVRTIVSIIGIALSCALVTAIFTTVTSLAGGLLERTLEADGSWQLSSPRVSESTLAQLAEAGGVETLAAGLELGSARITGDTADSYGELITLKTTPETLVGTGAATGVAETSEVGLVQLPALASGSYPTSASEILLPSFYEGAVTEGSGVSCADGTIGIGSTVTLELGSRSYTAEDGITVPLSSADYARDMDDAGDGSGTERLENVRTVSFTVAGFYDPGSWGYYSGSYGSSFAGVVAYTGPVGLTLDGSSSLTASAAHDLAGNDLMSGALVSPYLSTTLQSYSDVVALGDTHLGASQSYVSSAISGADAGYDATGSAGYVLNDTLLRYQGLTDDRAIWRTLWSLAAILTVVVVGASVSLIYTSFAISVTERMRQFGLLAGIGASKQQLRRTIMAEALMLGLIGIPAGLALGVAGTAATLSVTQAGFAAILGTETGVELVVEPSALALSAVIAAVTLAVSAWIPAVRAGRTSAVEAIRQARSARNPRLRRKNSGRLALRLFGVPGLIAHRNLTRSSSRGRVVVLSLAVSIALVVTCGVIDTYLRSLTDVASMSESSLDYDVNMSISYNPDGYADGTSYTERVATLVSEMNAREGTEVVGYNIQDTVWGVVPVEMINDEMRSWLEEQGAANDFTSSGDYITSVGVYYLSNEDWAAYVEECGLDLASYTDTEHPRAITYSGFSAYDSTRYVTLTPYAETGTIDIYSYDYSMTDAEGNEWTCFGIATDDAGEPVLSYMKLDASDNGLATDANGGYIEKTVPLDEGVTAHQSIEIGAYVDKIPDSLATAGIVSGFPFIILPESVLAASAAAPEDQSVLSASYAQLYLTADDDVEATTELERRAGELFGANHVYVYNAKQGQREQVSLVELIQLFIILFSVITMLIALANVFNTLTSSIILRTREFAMLCSAGMDNAAFTRMMLYECASYAVRGLVFGLALAGAASWAMWQAMSISFYGLGVAVPAVYIAAATLAALAVLAASAAYALRRVRSLNVMEALRRDAL